MNNKKKILVLCPYPHNRAAGQRLKYEQYFDSWRENDFDITISNFFEDDVWKVLYTKKGILKRFFGLLLGYKKRIKDLLNAKNYEVIYIFMWGTPIGLPFYENLLKKANNNIIYDYDDSIYLKNRLSFSVRDLIKSPLKPRFLIKHAKAVILSSPSNLEYSRNLNKYNQAVYVPCSVNTKRFKKINSKDTSVITLGWTGTFSSIKYLDLLNPILLDLNKILKFKLILITNFDYTIPNIDLEIINWNRSTEIEDLNKIDIGLYPLSKDSWALGKGGLKVIQYMSAEIPSIATDFGTAKDIITNGYNGFLVNTNEEWIDTIINLANDSALRRIIGSNGRKTIEKFYSVNANKEKYLNILNNL